MIPPVEILLIQTREGKYRARARCSPDSEAIGEAPALKQAILGAVALLLLYQDTPAVVESEPCV